MTRKSSRPSRADYVTRQEFAAVLRTLDDRRVLIEELQATCAVQFKRIAQIQAQLDEIRGAWVKTPRR